MTNLRLESNRWGFLLLLGHTKTPCEVSEISDLQFPSAILRRSLLVCLTKRLASVVNSPGGVSCSKSSKPFFRHVYLRKIQCIWAAMVLSIQVHSNLPIQDHLFS